MAVKSLPCTYPNTPQVITSPLKGSVFVQGECLRLPTINMWLSRQYEIVRRVIDADIICWTGGDDIHPNLYHEKCLPCTYPNQSRDNKDVEVYKEATHNHILVGLCRGGQLLNCLNGGSLWQNVDGHHHGVHLCTDLVTNNTVLLNTLHHQQMRVTDEAEILSVTQKSTFKEADNKMWTVGDDPDPDIEACWYDKTRSLCFQAHPEFSHKPTTDYFFQLLERMTDAA